MTTHTTISTSAPQAAAPKATPLNELDAPTDYVCFYIRAGTLPGEGKRIIHLQRGIGGEEQEVVFDGFVVMSGGRTVPEDCTPVAITQTRFVKEYRAPTAH